MGVGRSTMERAMRVQAQRPDLIPDIMAGTVAGAPRPRHLVAGYPPVAMLAEANTWLAVPAVTTTLMGSPAVPAIVNGWPE